jgi:hypothetical protein
MLKQPMCNFVLTLFISIGAANIIYFVLFMLQSPFCILPSCPIRLGATSVVGQVTKEVNLWSLKQHA